MSGHTLKPCPFCKGDAELLDWDFPYRRFQVRCSKCGATASGRRAHDPEAVAAWNERPIERELLEALEGILDALDSVSALDMADARDAARAAIAKAQEKSE